MKTARNGAWTVSAVCALAAFGVSAVASSDATPTWSSNTRIAGRITQIRTVGETLLLSGMGDVVALDRKTGRVLWGAYTEVPPTGSGDSGSSSPTLCGVTGDKDASPVAVIDRTVLHQTMQHEGSGQVATQPITTLRVEGVDVRTGAGIWSLEPAQGAGGVHIPLYGVFDRVLVAGHANNRPGLAYYDARTGTALDPKVPADHAVIAAGAGAMARLQTAGTPYCGVDVLRFNRTTGLFASGPAAPEAAGVPSLVASDLRHEIWYVDTGAGQNPPQPNYYICTDMRGLRVWDSARTVPPAGTQPAEAPAETTLTIDAVNMRDGSLLVTSQTRLYLFDAALGRARWTHLPTELAPCTMLKSATPCGAGYLMLTASPDGNRFALTYLDERTNKLHRIAEMTSDPGVLTVVDDDLLTMRQNSDATRWSTTVARWPIEELLKRAGLRDALNAKLRTITRRPHLTNKPDQPAW